MTYDREKLLKMLSNAPLDEESEFCEDMNEDLFYSIDSDFRKSFHYFHGATKLALVPIDNTYDYVIKIPYTGSLNRYDYYYNRYYHTYHKIDGEYQEFYGSESNERPWDYCATEVLRYQIAEEEGFARYFAKTELLGYVNNFPIYIQEKGIILDSGMKTHIHTKEEKMKTFSCCNYFKISGNWLTDFRLLYGEKELINFINFIKTMQWDDDLRSDNIGYINQSPVLIDYSGFSE